MFYYCSNNFYAGYVFENLSGGTFNNVVRILLSVELVLTFPIVFKPASDIMEEIFYNLAMVSYESLGAKDM